MAVTVKPAVTITRAGEEARLGPTAFPREPSWWQAWQQFFF